MRIRPTVGSSFITPPEPVNIYPPDVLNIILPDESSEDPFSDNENIPPDVLNIAARDDVFILLVVFRDKIPPAL